MLSISLIEPMIAFMCITCWHCTKKSRCFIFEETLFTKKIKRFPFFCMDRTLMDKYLPAEDLQREQGNRTEK